MEVSDRCLSLIKEFEGCKLTAYRCPAGVPTIGYGHTGHVRMGSSITQDEADRFLGMDVEKHAKAVESMLERVPSQGEFDAMVSFAYNLGAANLHSSTLLAKFNRGDKQGAANEFHKWCHCGHKTLPGLVRRRAAECKLFLA